MTISERIAKQVKDSRIVGLIVNERGKRYFYGESAYFDTQIINLILCPKGIDEWFGFRPDQYTPIYEGTAMAAGMKV